MYYFYNKKTGHSFFAYQGYYSCSVCPKYKHCNKRYLSDKNCWLISEKDEHKFNMTISQNINIELFALKCCYIDYKKIGDLFIDKLKKNNKKCYYHEFIKKNDYFGLTGLSEKEKILFFDFAPYHEIFLDFFNGEIIQDDFDKYYHEFLYANMELITEYIKKNESDIHTPNFLKYFASTTFEYYLTNKNTFEYYITEHQTGIHEIFYDFQEKNWKQNAIGVIIEDYKRDLKDYDPDLEIYEFSELGHLILLIVLSVLNQGRKINICQNCGKAFFTISRNDEKYCYLEYKNGKTCRELGFENLVSKDEILKIYRTAYKTQNARKQRNRSNIKDIDKKFNAWCKFAKEKTQECRDKKIDMEEFKKIISSSDWIK